jgi:hypothetical protein
MRKWMAYFLIGIVLLAIAGTAFVANAPTLMSPVLPTATLDATLPPLEQIKIVAREVTGDPNVLVQIIDGYLYVVYHVPENTEGGLLATYHSHLGAFMRRFDTISPLLGYAEAEFTARGLVGDNPDAIFAFARYDKDLVDTTQWDGLSDKEIVNIATRYRYNQAVQE